MKDSILVVTDNELCFGCGTCTTVCPVHAIKMEFASMGRLVPSVNLSTCTHCGLCMIVCPGIDTKGKLIDRIDETLVGHPRKVLFGRSTNDNVFLNAQSGGSVTETLAYLFDKDKIDAALVVVQEKQRARYKVIDSKQQLIDTQTSQYTPVDLVSALPLLLHYKHVAIVGLPCHIEGIFLLKERFPDKYANIEYLLGLICAGTQSQLVVDVVKSIAKKEVGEVFENDAIRWRQKKFSHYQRADIAIIGQQGEVKLLDNNIRHIAKTYLTSPRCKLCFDKLNLFADIVYGDAWGISGDDTKDGGNVIICRTEKGTSLIEEMAKDGRLKCRECPLEEVEKGQGMKKKQKTVSNMLTLYCEKSYRLPGWASSSVFDDKSNMPKSLREDVEGYWRRARKSPSAVVGEVSSKIKRQLFIAKIKRSLKRFSN